MACVDISHAMQKTLDYPVPRDLFCDTWAVPEKISLKPKRKLLNRRVVQKELFPQKSDPALFDGITVKEHNVFVEPRVLSDLAAEVRPVEPNGFKPVTQVAVVTRNHDKSSSSVSCACPISSIAFPQDCVISNVSTFLGFLDLCALDGTAKEVSKGIGWRRVALREGLSLPEMGKPCTKAALHVIQGHDLRGETVRVQSMKGVDELIKASWQIKSKRKTHLQDGGQIAAPFITHFKFSPEDVERYLHKPSTTISSLPIQVTVGTTTMELSICLTWRGGQSELWLSTYGDDEKSFKPFTVHLRTVASPLSMPRGLTFRVLRPRTWHRGLGLSCLLQTPEALVDSMRGGMLCVGLITELRCRRAN